MITKNCSLALSCRHRQLASAALHATRQQPFSDAPLIIGGLDPLLLYRPCDAGRCAQAPVKTVPYKEIERYGALIMAVRR